MKIYEFGQEHEKSVFVMFPFVGALLAWVTLLIGR